MSGKKEQITILSCANAIGQALLPMVIFDGKCLNYQWTTDEMSGKGWMDRELFKHWFQDHFLKYAPTRPLLLLMDGHSPHYEPSSVELAKNNDVILFCLPPHTTQDSQPLDCTVFGPLNVTGRQFVRLTSIISLDYLQRLGYLPSHLLIVSGFKKCGIYPFNRNANCNTTSY